MTYDHANSALPFQLPTVYSSRCSLARLTSGSSSAMVFNMQSQRVFALKICLIASVSCYPVIVEHTTITNNHIQLHDDPTHLPLPPHARTITIGNSSISLHDPSSSTTRNILHKRDSVTISIDTSFSNTTVINTQNDAKFEVINNAKNDNIAMGDHSNHTANFDSFGDKNMLNSTGSNTGGWNTKNQGSNLTTDRQKRDSDQYAMQSSWNNATELTNSSARPNIVYNIGHFICKRINCRNMWNSMLDKKVHHTARPEKRDVVNLNITGGKLHNSNLTNSANNNAVEVYVAGNGENMVNITIAWEADGSNLEDSENGNVVRIYVGDSHRVDMGNSTVFVAGERTGSDD